MNKSPYDFNGKNVIIALSGGGDSMYLLHQMINNGICDSMVAVHVKHNIRKYAPEVNEIIIPECNKYGIPVEIIDVDPSVYKKENVMAIARRERYRILTDVARKYPNPIILTAHHMDDVLENFIYRTIIRGSHINTAFTMSETAINGISVSRPLIRGGLWREEIRQENHRLGIPFFDDPSNDDIHYDRVKIRKMIEHGRRMFGIDTNSFKMAYERYVDNNTVETTKCNISPISNNEIGFIINGSHNKEGVFFLNLSKAVARISNYKNRIPSIHSIVQSVRRGQKRFTSGHAIIEFDHDNMTATVYPDKDPTNCWKGADSNDINWFGFEWNLCVGDTKKKSFGTLAQMVSEDVIRNQVRHLRNAGQETSFHRMFRTPAIKDGHNIIVHHDNFITNSEPIEGNYITFRKIIQSKKMAQ